MRVPKDLHDDDLKSRILLAGELRSIREAAGVSTRDLDTLFGVGAGTTAALERRTSWEARTKQRYARALGRRIEFTLNDLTIPDDDDIMTVVLAAGDTSTPERADRVHWRTICNQLRRIRRATVTAVEMGRRLSVTENAVHYWDANPDGSSLISAQRYARALGGHLGWLLHRAPVHVTPRQRVG